MSWEKNHPERKAWSTFVFELISAELFETLDMAKDAKRLYPKYEVLAKNQRIQIWGELVSAMAYFESGWSPTSRMAETTVIKEGGKYSKIDPIISMVGKTGLCK